MLGAISVVVNIRLSNYLCIYCCDWCFVIRQNFHTPRNRMPASRAAASSRTRRRTWQHVSKVLRLTCRSEKTSLPRHCSGKSTGWSCVNFSEYCSTVGLSIFACRTSQLSLSVVAQECERRPLGRTNASQSASPVQGSAVPHNSSPPAPSARLPSAAAQRLVRWVNLGLLLLLAFSWLALPGWVSPVHWNLHNALRHVC